MVTIADSAANAEGARIKPQAAAANPISVNKMARMASLRIFSVGGCQPVQRAEAAGGSRDFQKLSERRRGNRKARPEGLGRAFPSRALHRHRDSLLWRLFGVR